MVRKHVKVSLKVPKLAIASLVCAILALITPLFLKILLGLAAIVIGVISLKMIAASHGVLYGKSVAYGGIIIPSLIILFMVVGSLFKPGGKIGVGDSNNTRDVEACASNLKELGKALVKYKADNGNYPTALFELIPNYVTDTSLFWCPGDRDSKKPKNIKNENDALTSYSYTPPESGDVKKPWQVLLLSDNSLDNHGGAGKNIFMADGMVYWSKAAVKKK